MTNPENVWANNEPTSAASLPSRLTSYLETGMPFPAGSVQVHSTVVGVSVPHDGCSGASGTAAAAVGKKKKAAKQGMVSHPAFPADSR